MGTLSSKARGDLPAKDFGIPGRRAYPMPDASHARNAEARATQMERAGKLSASTADKIKAMARRKLGKG